LEKIYIRDPIYDEIAVYRETEESLINRWELQRLRYIKQLQLTYLVYPSAIHTRFEHSLGVMHVAGEFMNRLLENAESLSYIKNAAGLSLVSDTAFTRMNRIIARIAGLLHDIGHGPLGHIFDEYIVPQLYDEHERSLLERACFSHELIGFLIYWHKLRDLVKSSLDKIEQLKRYTEDLLNWLDQVMIPICRDPETGKPRYHEIFRISTSGYGYFIRMVVRDYLYPADLMDYLLRDSRFSGAVELGMINRYRLMRNTKPIPVDYVLERLPKDMMAKQVELYKLLPTPIILAIDEKALPDLIRFLDARRLMYENVYLHKAIRAFVWSAVSLLINDLIWHHVGFDKKLLLKVLEKPKSSDLVEAFLEEYLELTDAVLLKARELVKKGVVRSDAVKLHVDALFEYRKPVYKSVHSEIIPAEPHLVPDAKLSKQLRELERELLESITSGLTEHVQEDSVKVGIEQIQIYPATAWNIQGPSIYTITRDRRLWVYSVEEFSAKYHLSNIGEVRLYVSRALEERVKRALAERFVTEVRHNAEKREKIKQIVGITVISTVTM